MWRGFVMAETASGPIGAFSRPCPARLIGWRGGSDIETETDTQGIRNKGEALFLVSWRQCNGSGSISCFYIQYSGVHVLYRKFNYRNIKLEDECSGHTVEVLRRDGKFEHVMWLGFINRFDARSAAGRSVKLRISRVDGQDLKPGEYVQGCLTARGVYAVVDSEVAIIR